MRGFIDLALDTADDSDWTITLLTDLRAVGCAMGQLLFELPDPCELEDLLRACGALWKISHLHKLLVCCINYKLHAPCIQCTSLSIIYAHGCMQLYEFHA